MTSSLPDLSGLTILVIEDDPDGLQLLTTALTACGARVLTATDTTIARGHLETVKLDLVVTDLGLPGETGAAFISWLRTQPPDKGGNLAAIAVTGYPKDFPVVRLGGFAAYFEKPLDLDNVCETIRGLMRPPSAPTATRG
jgi:DNA-binding response OmpR family regulator